MKPKKTIQNYLKDIRELVGKNYCHKEHGKFKYYTSDNYCQVVFKNIEIGSFKVFDKNKTIYVNFELNDGIPTEGEILAIVRKAKYQVAKISKVIQRDILIDKKQEIKDLKEQLKQLNKEIK